MHAHPRLYLLVAALGLGLVGPAARAEEPTPAERGQRARAALAEPVTERAFHYLGRLSQQGRAAGTIEIDVAVEATEGGARWRTQETVRLGDPEAEGVLVSMEGLHARDLSGERGAVTLRSAGRTTTSTWQRTEAGYTLLTTVGAEAQPARSLVAPAGLLVGLAPALVLARTLPEEPTLVEVPTLSEDHTAAGSARLEVLGVKDWDLDALHRRAWVLRLTLGAQTSDLAFEPRTRRFLGFANGDVLCVSEPPTDVLERLPEWWAPGREQPVRPALVREAEADLHRGEDERTVLWLSATGRLAWRTSDPEPGWAEADLSREGPEAREPARARVAALLARTAETRRTLLLRADGATPWARVRQVLALAAQTPGGPLPVAASVERRPDAGPERFGVLPLNPYVLSGAERTDNEVRAFLVSSGEGAQRETRLSVDEGAGIVLPPPADRRRALTLSVFITGSLLKRLGAQIRGALPGEEPRGPKSTEPSVYVDVSARAADEVPLEDVLALLGPLRSPFPGAQLLCGAHAMR